MQRIDMAKRVSLFQFASDISKHHQKSKFTRQEIKAFASYKGVTVPGEIWDCAIDRNVFSMDTATDRKLVRPIIKFEELQKDKTVDELFEDLNALVSVVGKKNSIH